LPKRHLQKHQLLEDAFTDTKLAWPF